MLRAWDAPVTAQEVMDTLEFLPSGVAPGKDNILYEMYSCVPEIAAEVIAKVADLIAEQGKAPGGFLNSVTSQGGKA